MSSRRTTPRKTTVPTKQIGSLLQLQCGVVHGCVCVCARVGMHAMLFIVQCVHVLTHVTYNTAQVKMGQNSRRAAWADLGVAPRVCAVVSISTDVTGLRPIFLCLDYTAGPGNEVGGIVLNFIFSTEHV